MVFIPRLGKKRKVRKVSYQGREIDAKARLDPDVVGNFSVYVKEMKHDWQRYLGFPYGSLLSPKVPEKRIQAEYRVKGSMKEDSLELEIDRLEPAVMNKMRVGSGGGPAMDEDCRLLNAPTKKYSPLPAEEPNLERIAKRYISELSNYTSAKAGEKAVNKAIRSWEKDLKLQPLAAETLRQYALAHTKDYHTRECTLLIVPFPGLVMFKAGQMMAVGGFGSHTYRRRVSPIIGMPPFNILNNAAAAIAEKIGCNLPQETVFENPEESAIILPPIVGSFARKHEIRHCFQYGSFSEILNPESLIYAKHSKEEAKQRAYAHLEELVSKYFISSDRVPDDFDDKDRKIVGGFMRGNLLSGLMDEIKQQDLLSSSYERGIISGVLFHEAYKSRKEYYESTASSINGNFQMVALPWVLTWLIGGIEMVQSAWYLNLGINLLAAKYGYGNLPRLFHARQFIKQQDTPEDQLMAIASLGKLKYGYSKNH